MKISPAYFFSKEKNENGVSNREMLAYASGAGGYSVAAGYVSGRITYFYENHIVPGKNSHYVGKIMTASIVWDAINDVLVGSYVDRKKHRPFAKMRPYTLYCPPIAGLLGMAMFLAFGSSDMFRLGYLLSCYFFWDLICSFEEVGIWGKLALSNKNPHERSRVTQWVVNGGGLGGYIPKTFPFFWDILKKTGMSEKSIFILFAILFSVVGQALAMNTTRFKERIDTPPQESESFFKSLSVIRYNPTLLLVGGAKIAREIYPRIDRTYFYQSAFRNSSGLKGGTAETMYDTVSSIPGACSAFFANKLIDRFGGHKKSLIVSQIAIISARIISYGIGKIPGLEYNTFPGFLTMCIIIGASSTFTSFMDVSHRSLINNSVDEVELKTGLRTEGISTSALSFSNKLNKSLVALISNVTLYSFLGYRVDEGDPEYIFHQSEKFYKWQYPIYMLSPVIGEALYILVISFVRDDKEHTAEVARELEKRRAQLNMNVQTAETE